MKRIFATLAIAALPLFPNPSFAGIPMPATAVGAGVQLGGVLSGVTDPHATVRFRILDGSNQPIPGSTVDLLFGNCTFFELRIATTQSFAGMTWDCSSKTARAVTNANGDAFFCLRGAALAGPGNPLGMINPCVAIRADGVLLGTSRLAAYDLDGKNGVNAADQSLFMSTLFAGPPGYRSRADYNGDGLVNTADLARLLGVLLAGQSATSAGVPYCF